MILEPLSLGYGILSMISFGFGDFFSKRVMADVGYFRLIVYSQLVSLVPVLFLGVVFTLPMPSSLTTVVILLASGVCSLSALFLFYKGLEVGKASVITPVYSAYAIVAILLSFAIFGEVLSVWQIACVAMTLTGVFAITLMSDSGERAWSPGIPYALGSMFSVGVGSVLIKLVSEDIGGIAALFFNRLLAVGTLAVLGVVFIRNRPRLRANEGFPVRSIVLIGLAEFAGFSSFVFGLAVGMVSLVTTLSSASPAVTVVLAQVFLRERLVRIQKFATVLVILGILLLSIAST
jgi:drug/metabolite transporter (DMT)-like permease